MTRAEQVGALFAEAFGGPPAGVWSAPGRVNLIGEHTDYTGGFVMPFAIDQRAHLAVRPRSDRVVAAVASGRGRAEVSLDDVGPGRPAGWLGYLAGAAWVGEQAGAVDPRDAHGWDLALLSDVPVGAGLSSSAAITCAALLAMNDLGGWARDGAELALWGQRVENTVVGIPCGIMDQSASLRCREGSVLFMDTESGAVEHVPWLPASQAVILVTDTRAPHALVDGQYASRRRLCEEATAILGRPSLRHATLADLDRHAAHLAPDQRACAHHVISENDRVLRVVSLLTQGRVHDVGKQLTASHASLRDDFRVTIPQLDVSVEAALAAGAHGARMTGGGFGGCTIALIDPAGAPEVSHAIDEAFAGHGFTAPEHFVAQPRQGARRDT